MPTSLHLTARPSRGDEPGGPGSCGHEHPGTCVRQLGQIQHLPTEPTTPEQVITIVTFMAVWWGKGIPAHRTIRLQLVTAAAIAGVMWIFVAFCVLGPFWAHSKPGDMYFAPTPVRVWGGGCFFAAAGGGLMMHLLNFLALVHDREAVRTCETFRKVPLVLDRAHCLVLVVHPFGAVESGVCHCERVEVPSSQEDARQGRPGPAPPFFRDDCVRPTLSSITRND